MRQLANGAKPDPNTVTERVHVVSGLRDDGRVDLQVGIDPQVVVTGVPALRSYTNRAVGDRVVVRKRRRSWLVTGALTASTDDTSAVPAGAYRFSITRTTAASITSAAETIFPFNGTPTYANGVSLVQNGKAVRIANPGLYLLSAAIQLDGNPTNGNRFEAWLADYSNKNARYVSGSTYLPARYPIISLVNTALLTTPDKEIAIWYYTSATGSFYIPNNANYFSVSYLGPI